MLAEELTPTPPAAGRHTVDDAAAALIEHKRVQGVSKSYLATLSGAQRHHFGALGSMPLRKVHRRDIEAMSAQLLLREVPCVGTSNRTLVSRLPSPWGRKSTPTLCPRRIGLDVAVAFSIRPGVWALP